MRLSGPPRRSGTPGGRSESTRRRLPLLSPRRAFPTTGWCPLPMPSWSPAERGLWRLTSSRTELICSVSRGVESCRFRSRLSHHSPLRWAWRFGGTSLWWLIWRRSWLWSMEPRSLTREVHSFRKTRSISIRRRTRSWAVTSITAGRWRMTSSSRFGWFGCPRRSLVPEWVLLLYGGIAVACWLAALLLHGEPGVPRRWPARLALAAPVWPVAVALALVWGGCALWRAAEWRGLFRD
ncbi:hypothetical protein PSCLAVI8L_130517 [Pseudoclavibacter sp. 8L]|nr:hypothetical protein PSCLAVI8L_130517 [Pseudoclavibacter sp. 8L]